MNENSPETPSDRIENTVGSDGMQLLGSFDGFEAARLLKRFSAANISFEIDRIERREQRGMGRYYTRGYIQIFIHSEDYERARQIVTADWKV